MAYKEWVVREADKERASEISAKFNIDPFIAYLLVSRGISDDVAVSDFINDTVEYVSPFNFADMEEAMFAIGDAVDGGEKICIYGDYDCDGVTATALLVSFLRNEGADVFYYIPSRTDEGYGLNKDAVDKIKEQGANLIVTVDNGISSLDEAEYIYSLGMRLVVTDHHQIGDTLPKAEAVINPYRKDNTLEFCDYCGVGVAFKLICAMSEDDVESLMGEYLDLVAVGTVADMVPLIGENRFFVKAGLEILNNRPRPAFKEFLEQSKNKITSSYISFNIAPRLNSFGRMGDASKAVELLLSEVYFSDTDKKDNMDYINSLRKETEDYIIEDIEKQIKNNPDLVKNRIIVISKKGYHTGVLGIVANKIVSRYSKPVILIGIDDDGIARGSARSVDGINIYEAISHCKDDLIRYGGHPLAAGVTLKEENINLFCRHINEFAYNKYPVTPNPKLILDCKISPSYINEDLISKLGMLEPYGESNPEAVFGVYKITLKEIQPLKEGRHLRLIFSKGNTEIPAVKFNMTPQEFPYKAGDVMNIAVRLSFNISYQKRYISTRIVDMKLSSNDDKKYFSEKKDYEDYITYGKAKPEFYPNREDFALVYRYLTVNGGYEWGFDNLYFRLQNRINYSKMMICLSAFEETGLINTDTQIRLNNVNKKVNLQETKVLKELRERINLV